MKNNIIVKGTMYFKLRVTKKLIEQVIEKAKLNFREEFDDEVWNEATIKQYLEDEHRETTDYGCLDFGYLEDFLWEILEPNPLKWIEEPDITDFELEV